MRPGELSETASTAPDESAERALTAILRRAMREDRDDVYPAGTVVFTRAVLATSEHPADRSKAAERALTDALHRALRDDAAADFPGPHTLEFMRAVLAECPAARSLVLPDSQQATKAVEFSVQIDGAREDGMPSWASALRMTVSQHLMYQLHILQILCKNHGLSEVRKPREERAPDGRSVPAAGQEFVVSGDVFRVRYWQGGDDVAFLTAPKSIGALDAAYEERVVSGDTSLLDLGGAESGMGICSAERDDRPRG